MLLWLFHLKASLSTKNYSINPFWSVVMNQGWSFFEFKNKKGDFDFKTLVGVKETRVEALFCLHGQYVLNNKMNVLNRKGISYFFPLPHSIFLLNFIFPMLNVTMLSSNFADTFEIVGAMSFVVGDIRKCRQYFR